MAFLEYCAKQSHRSRLTYQRCLLPPTSHPYESVSTSETLVYLYKIKRHSFPEDFHLHTCHCDNLKSYSHLRGIPDFKLNSYSQMDKPRNIVDCCCGLQPRVWVFNHIGFCLLGKGEGRWNYHCASRRDLHLNVEFESW